MTKKNIFQIFGLTSALLMIAVLSYSKSSKDDGYVTAYEARGGLRAETRGCIANPANGR
jgi:Tfp pilus assembly major pilin PilA